MAALLALVVVQDATAQTCPAADSALGALPVGQGKVRYDRLTDSLRFEAPSVQRNTTEVRFVGLGLGDRISAAALEVSHVRIRVSRTAVDRPAGVDGDGLPVLVDGERRLVLAGAIVRDQATNPVQQLISDAPIEVARWPLTVPQLVELARADRVETRYANVALPLGRKQLEGARAIAAAWLCQTPLR